MFCGSWRTSRALDSFRSLLEVVEELTEEEVYYCLKLEMQTQRRIVAELKTKIKAAKDNVKQFAGIAKEADKTYAAAGKAHLATLKANDKAAAAAAKELVALEAQLNALTAPVAAD